MVEVQATVLEGVECRDVRFGSKADICGAPRHVRFTPESGHSRQLETPQKQSVQLIARFGSSADISHCNRLVRFYPASAVRSSWATAAASHCRSASTRQAGGTIVFPGCSLR
jgi:hypothetical protein